MSPHSLPLPSLPTPGLALQRLSYARMWIRQHTAHPGHPSGLWGDTIGMACPRGNRLRYKACKQDGDIQERDPKIPVPQTVLPSDPVT